MNLIIVPQLKLKIDIDMLCFIRSGAFGICIKSTCNMPLEVVDNYMHSDGKYQHIPVEVVAHLETCSMRYITFKLQKTPLICDVKILHTCVCMSVCMYVCMHVCTYVCMCMYSLVKFYCMCIILILNRDLHHNQIHSFEPSDLRRLSQVTEM